MADTSISIKLLRAIVDPKTLTFRTTASLEPLIGPLGQERAVEAIRLSAQMRHRRFNLYVYGAEGSGRHSTVLRLLEEVAAQRPVPSDWVYLQNFSDPDRPLAVSLPLGHGVKLRAAMSRLAEDLVTHIPALLVSEDYQNRRTALDQDFAARHEAALDDLRNAAQAREVAIIKTPMGYSLAAMQAGEVVKPDVMAGLPVAARQQLDANVTATRDDLEDFLLSLPELGRAESEAIAELNARMAGIAVNSAMSKITKAFAKVPALEPYFEALRADLIDKADLFLSLERSRAENPFPPGIAALRDDPRFNRYRVNVIASHTKSERGAPVVVETLPTLSNLTGRIDYLSIQGALVTDFTQIKPGALHRANGGFLVLDARRILNEPHAWEGLKRCLETTSVHVIADAERLGLTATMTLEPQPIPLDVRVILIGDRMLHMLLSELDPDFEEFFRVAAEFGEDTRRSLETITLFARMVATIVEKEGMRAVTRDGVAALADAATRAAEDQEKISLRLNRIWDILREADHIAAQSKARTVNATHIAAAIAAADRRTGGPRERLQEMIARGGIMISTAGSIVGQVNGLSLVEIGDLRIGAPVRITARVRMGAGNIIDIEREAKLGGPLHSKAVLILSSYLATRYAIDVPFSLWASLVFEQTYGGVEGDSASLAEFCTLMSALSDVPISQSFAVTGSVNQMGEVQPIGGINEKIEGFFDVCVAQGLTGRQGVIIPKQNVVNLMLRPDVVDAVAKSKFQIHAVSHVDEAVAQLTGLPAGERAPHGDFEDGTINANIEVRLLGFAEARAMYRGPSDSILYNPND